MWLKLAGPVKPENRKGRNLPGRFPLLRLREQIRLP
jgi:hypothetical protein